MRLDRSRGQLRAVTGLRVWMVKQGPDQRQAASILEIGENGEAVFADVARVMLQGLAGMVQCLFRGAEPGLVQGLSRAEIHMVLAPIDQETDPDP